MFIYTLCFLYNFARSLSLFFFFWYYELFVTTKYSLKCLNVCIGYMTGCTPCDIGDTRITATPRVGSGGLVKTWMGEGVRRGFKGVVLKTRQTQAPGKSSGSAFRQGAEDSTPAE